MKGRKPAGFRGKTFYKTFRAVGVLRKNVQIDTSEEPSNVLKSTLRWKRCSVWDAVKILQVELRLPGTRDYGKAAQTITLPSPCLIFSLIQQEHSFQKVLFLSHQNICPDVSERSCSSAAEHAMGPVLSRTVGSWPLTWTESGSLHLLLQVWICVSFLNINSKRSNNVGL